MKLTVQSFERRFSPEDPKINEKIKDFCETLVQQIDTMSAVASAFSNFASMPSQENTTLDVVKTVQLALEIFNEDFFRFESRSAEHTSELQSRPHLVCRLLLEKKKKP